MASCHGVRTDALPQLPCCLHRLLQIPELPSDMRHPSNHHLYTLAAAILVDVAETGTACADDVLGVLQARDDTQVVPTVLQPVAVDVVHLLAGLGIQEQAVQVDVRIPPYHGLRCSSTLT